MGRAPSAGVNAAFDRFLDAAFVRMMAEVPELPTHMGIFAVGGIACLQDRFTDTSESGALRRLRLLDELRARLRAFAREPLDEHRRLTAEVLEFFFSYAQERDWIGVEGKAFWDHRPSLRPGVGLQAELPLFLTEMHPMRHAQDAHDYVARVRQIPLLMTEAAASLARQRAKGIVAPSFQIDDTIAEANAFIACGPLQNSVYTVFADKTTVLPDVSDRAREELLAQVEHHLQSGVYPAYRAAIEALRAQRESAGNHPGVWALPDGEDYYEFLLRGATTTELNAADIHELGREQVAAISARICDQFRAMGYHETSVADAFRRFDATDSEPRADTEENRRQIVEELRSLIADVRAELPRWFMRLPRAEAVVEPIPRFAEHTRNQTYHPPSRDGSRPGVFDVNVRNLLATPNLSLPTLVFHETWPGHHLQLSLALENEELPHIRRALTFDAYIEGWAKYAEVLPFEQGFEQTDRQRLLSQRAELVSTVNLVLDTGIHSRRWSREQAILFFADATGMPHDFATYVVHRSAATPAQLCSYKIGLTKFRELEARIRAAQGAHFDLRLFHDLVLENGALPLGVLERTFDQALAKRSEA